MKDDILLIDGNSMLFRAYYATSYTGNFMTTHNGIPTNAVFGFANMINKAIRQIDPGYIFVAWDAGKPTFRHEAYAGYKGTRKESDEELKVQFSIAREYLDAYHIVRYEKEGIEADDIIGTLAKRYPDRQVHILSSDKDLLQLIDATTDVLLMKKGLSDLQVMDENGLKESMGITPAQVIDYKGLAGDNSDNIPGIKGVGDKTAVKLLNQYGSIEGIYEHIDELKGKMKEKIINGKADAYMSKMLATIKTDASIPYELDDLALALDETGVNAFYRKYEMNSLIHQETAKVKKQIPVEIVTHFQADMFSEGMFVVLDYDNESYYETTLNGILLKDEHHIYYMNKEDMLMDEALEQYLDSGLSKYAYDVKNIYHLLDRYGFAFKPFSFDVMIAASLCDSAITNYDKLLDKYQHRQPQKKSELYGKPGRPKLPDFQDKLDYYADQIQFLADLSIQLEKEMESKDLSRLFHDIEMPLATILYKMEKEGVHVDTNVLDELASTTLALIQDLEAQIYAQAGHEFNVNSPKQLGIVLFDELGLPSGKKRSTAADVLEKLQDKHPIVPLLLAQRKYQKIYSTYAEGLKKYVGHDQKIHTIFNQCLTQTGRLSSSEPNLQNISVKDDEGKQVRKAFVAPEGYWLYTVDYSQIELRMLAHMAHEEKMIEAFKQDMDIHTQTAMEIYGVGKDEVSKPMRRQAKTVNFGIIYGQSEFGLAQELGISRNDAKEFMDRYFASYPQIKIFMDSTVAFCKENGYVKTIFNRRRLIPEINDSNYMTREFGKRAAMNAPIQGSAADLIKLAMIKVDGLLDTYHLQSKLILQVHDELIFLVKDGEQEILEKVVKEGMEHAYELDVPLKADGGFGKDYYSIK